MRRWIRHVSAGLLALGLLGAGCTAVLGIDKDYREAAGGAGGGGGPAGPGSGPGGPGSGPGSGGGAQSSVASTSSGGSPEDCFNTKDDNGDGKVDCADPLCGGVAACMDVPAGWSPVWVMNGADPTKPPGKCADGSPQKLYFTNPAGPPTCSACGCASGAGAACGAPEISCYYGNSSCSGAAGFVKAATDTNCLIVPGIPPSVTVSSCKLSGSAAVINNACTVTNSVPTPAPMWGSAVLACDSPADPGGCGGGQLCLGTQPSTDGPLCIKRDGTDACPAGWAQAISAFADGIDNRSCGACSCTLGCSGGSYVVHSLTACLDGQAPVTINSTNCSSAGAAFDNSSASLTPTLATPTVTACTGGQPQGQVKGANPVQICCK